MNDAAAAEQNPQAAEFKELEHLVNVKITKNAVFWGGWKHFSNFSVAVDVSLAHQLKPPEDRLLSPRALEGIRISGIQLK